MAEMAERFAAGVPHRRRLRLAVSSHCMRHAGLSSQDPADAKSQEARGWQAPRSQAVRRARRRPCRPGLATTPPAIAQAGHPDVNSVSTRGLTRRPRSLRVPQHADPVVCGDQTGRQKCCGQVFGGLPSMRAEAYADRAAPDPAAASEMLRGGGFRSLLLCAQYCFGRWKWELAMKVTAQAVAGPVLGQPAARAGCQPGRGRR
jgi:hypothetical protein